MDALLSTQRVVLCAHARQLARRKLTQKPATSHWRSTTYTRPLILSNTLSQRRPYSTPPPNPSLAPAVDRTRPKVWSSADEAVADLKSGSTILSAGFGLCGVAETIIEAMRARGPDGPNALKNLTAVSNNTGIEGVGGLGQLTRDGQIQKLIISFLGNNKALEKKFLTGHISVELCPQGTLAERIRAGGAGIPAFYTPTAVNTLLEQGKIPKLYSDNGDVLEYGSKRETREFNGRKYLMETALTGDVAIMRAAKVDEAGNCMFDYTTKAFGPIMAKAAQLTIVEAEEIVKVGELDPNHIDLPGIYVDRIVPATAPKNIEIKRLKQPKHEAATGKGRDARRERIARRTAKELKHGYYVNLGVGLPTSATAFLDPNIKVWLQSENGILGMGDHPTEEQLNPDIVNAGKETVTLVPGAACFASDESFGMIRGGHVDVSVLGALQVDSKGNLANYMVPGKTFKGMGGAMDLVSNPEGTKVVVATEHVAKDGSTKIVKECNWPLTGARCVSTIITDMCVFEVDIERGEMYLTELAPDVTVDDIRQNTEAEFKVADNLKQME